MSLDTDWLPPWMFLLACRLRCVLFSMIAALKQHLGNTCYGMNHLLDVDWFRSAREEGIKINLIDLVGIVKPNLCCALGRNRTWDTIGGQRRTIPLLYSKLNALKRHANLNFTKGFRRPCVNTDWTSHCVHEDLAHHNTSLFFQCTKAYLNRNMLASWSIAASSTKARRCVVFLSEAVPVYMSFTTAAHFMRSLGCFITSLFVRTVTDVHFNSERATTLLLEITFYENIQVHYSTVCIKIYQHWVLNNHKERYK